MRKYPPLNVLFPVPKAFEPCRITSARLCIQQEKFTSDKLLTAILYLFEINETQVDLAYIPGKGWGVGCTLSTTLQGVIWESQASDPPFNRCPGHILLSLLFTLIVDRNYSPIVMEPGDWIKRKAACGGIPIK